jgi:hypothetical protein
MQRTACSTFGPSVFAGDWLFTTNAKRRRRPGLLGS